MRPGSVTGRPNPSPPPPPPAPGGPLGGVSCLCLTYGRVHLLEEAIQSFLLQQWEGPKELIVLNDHPAQTLLYDHPEVLVVNLPRRLRSLGEKRNLSVSLARYDNLLVWDDDDIYLPWRIAETMRTLPSDQFYKCPNAWCITNGVWVDEPGYMLFHGGTAYTRWLFQAAGGYAPLASGEDAEIEWRFQNVTDQQGEYWKHTMLPWERLYYVYRWGHGSYHTTGHTDLANIDPPVQAGPVRLRPRWTQDYVAIARSKVGRTAARGGSGAP